MAIAYLRPTGEQLAAVDACTADANVVIEAGAGTGKTSTLRMIAAAMDNRRGMYIACNRATADAARRTFPRSALVATAHSLAFNAVGHRYASRLPGSAPRLPSWRVADLLGIAKPLPIGEDLVLTPAHLARIVMGTIERFCHSADPVITASHLPVVHGLSADVNAELSWRIAPLARRAWMDLQRTDGRLPFKHDHYLKLWQLSGARIFADYVMFDEAQDANPVTAAIVQGHRDGQQIIVGDSCQAIYGWRGAVDALSGWPCDVLLNLTQSFRFGGEVATEANKWLEALRARYRLAGSPSIPSVVGEVTTPQVIVCRTNAEAFAQARSCLGAGRRAAFAGSGADLKHLAEAALDLQTGGRTNHPDLAVFRDWGQVQNYICTDAAGADLAASIRIIDKHGVAQVLGTIAQLTSERRAEVIACTVHAAKGREWERVLIAGDFTEPAGDVMTRADAMLGYVAVTRARIQLDRSGLAWIDNRLPAAKRPEAMMNTRSADNNPLGGSATRVYAGGRAQAESGCLIIANDYDAWSAVSRGVRDEPRVVQLGQAWRTIVKRDLDDEPGPAGVRYRVLSHAASALASVRQDPRELAALELLASHARVHGDRLLATAESLFARSPKSGPYRGGLAEASSGSRIVEKDYITWARSSGADQAAREDAMRGEVKRLRKAWDEIRDHGLRDGPDPAAARYRELADASLFLADNFPLGLPSSGLGLVLDLAGHAHKHAIRLRATADARDGAGPAGRDRQVEAIASEFESRGHLDQHSNDAGHARRDKDQVAHTRRYGRRRGEQDRQR